MQWLRFRDAMLAHAPTLRSVVLTSGARAYAALTTFVSLVLTVRWLGAEARGAIVVVTTWVTLFANLGSLTLWQVSVHRGAEGRGKPWLGPFLGALLIVSVAGTLAGWIIIAGLAGVARTELFHGIPLLALAIGFVALPFQMWEFFVASLLSVVGRLGFFNLNQIVSRTIGLVAMIVGVKLLGLGIYGVLVAFLLTEILISAAGLTVLARQATGALRDGVKELPGLIRDGLKMHLHTIGVLLYGSSDILLLHHFKGTAAAGIYQFASTTFMALLLIPHSAVLALQSKVGSTSLEGFWPEHRTIIAVGVLGMSLVAAAVWLIAPWLTVILVTPRFIDAARALRILVIALPVATFVWLMLVQWLARGLFLPLGLLFFSMGLLNLVLNLFLVPRFGGTGAAWSTVLMWFTLPLAANILMVRLVQREHRALLSR